MIKINKDLADYTAKLLARQEAKERRLGAIKSAIKRLCEFNFEIVIRW